MAPWKIVRQPQKVSRAARVSGMVGTREIFKLLLQFIEQSVTFFTFCMKYKNTHGIDIKLQSINSFYKYYINTPLKFNIYNISQQ